MLSALKAGGGFSGAQSRRARNWRRCAVLLAGWVAVAAPVGAYTPDLRGVDTLPLQLAPAAVAAKSLALPRKGEPLRFARAVPLASGLEQGRWERLQDGGWRWRTRVLSVGAVSLNFEFSDFHMPAGGELWIYDAQGHLVQGPYTTANHTPEGRLWTALVRGESAVIEARVPAAGRDQLRLRLGRVNHGDVDFFKDGLFGNAGSCNIDVACSQGDTWSQEQRAVALLQAGDTICSGVLVNNVRQDNTPYLLTANHCDIRSNGTHPASSVVVYWRYQSSACNAGDGDASHNQSGTTFMARDLNNSDNSDYTLLRLNQAPSASFNVHYAGWDVTGAAANSGAGLHHPHGDVKKISLFGTPLTRATLHLAGSTLRTWEVAHWDQGVTEQGSSGSGLWDQAHHLVGLLTAGSSQCTVDNSDSSAPRGPNEPDYYGRLELAWNHGLKARLDPDGSGVTVLCGRDPAEGACSAQVAPIVGSGGGSGSPITSAKSSGGGAMPGLFLLVFVLARRMPRLRRA